jgi:hypothetical protein
MEKYFLKRLAWHYQKLLSYEPLISLIWKRGFKPIAGYHETVDGRGLNYRCIWCDFSETFVTFCFHLRVACKHVSSIGLCLLFAEERLEWRWWHRKCFHKA